MTDSRELDLNDLDQVSGGRTASQEMSLLRMEVERREIQPWQAQKDFLMWEVVQAQDQMRSRQEGKSFTIHV